MRILRASTYIIVCSAKNRARVRLRRLREPRYLIGAVVGVAYLYFAVWARIGGRRPRPRSALAAPVAVSAAFRSLVASIGGAALLALAALTWIFPPSSGLLDFTEPEVQLLFPAPVSRRQLLLHRLMRSQLGLLFAAMVPAFVITSPTLQTGSAWTRLLRGLALWVVFVTVRVYVAGVALARARLAARDPSSRRVAWLPLMAIIGAAAIVAIPLGRALLGGAPVRSFDDMSARITAVIGGGLPQVVLWPFVSLVRPLVSEWPWPYLLAMPGAVLVMTATIVWVLQSDAAFQEAAESALQRRAERQNASLVRTSRDFGWSLRLTGPIETLFLWKNGMQTLRGTNLVQVMRFLLPMTILGVAAATARMSATQSRGAAAGLASASISIAGFFTILGPLAVQSDLRGDLMHLELLKTWPVRAAALIRGELMWPTMLMTFSAWVPLLCAAVLSAAAFPSWPLAARLSVSVAALVLVPAVIASQFMVHAAAALLFPAWVPTGRHRPRGLEAMGQRLIFLGVMILSLALVLGPAALVGGIAVFVFYRFIGIVIVIPAALVCSVAVVIEIVALTEILGGRFERIDLSQVERPD